MPTDTPAIYAALAAVMADCDHVAKRDFNEHQRFAFRGVDAVINATGPFFRRHKVTVYPTARKIDYRENPSRNGGVMVSARVHVDYTFVSLEDGSSLTTSVFAEAFDSGDKATAKAMSVAFRTALLQSLALPTDEPDPDADSYTRDAQGHVTQVGHEHAVTPRQQHDPTIAKREQVAATWMKRHGAKEFDIDAASAEFAEHVGGDLRTAPVEALDLYLTHLTGEDTP